MNAHAPLLDPCSDKSLPNHRGDSQIVRANMLQKKLISIEFREWR